MTAVPAAEATPEPTALYRVWGEADLLLYIGISNDFGRRWKQHARLQPWWDEKRRLTVDEWLDSREDAETTETAAIRAEKPKYNKKDVAVEPPARNRRTPSGLRTYTSEEGRREWRRILSAVDGGDCVEITRYGDPLAVVVPAEWHEHQRAALAAFAEAGMDGDVPVSAREVRARVVSLAGLLDGMRKYIHPEIPESTFADYWKKLNEQVGKLCDLLPENAEERS